MSSDIAMNSELRHITILEEAHNLLRRTSMDQSQEGANLFGKSVEMISNSIAEMRTYGEGFIIVDQAPGLVDMSAIRNTNTKIIMKLPDETDRELVGKAANLNDDQIREVAKLPCGVAAVYQNEWVQPVLCKVDRFEKNTPKYVFNPDVNENLILKDRDISESLLKTIMDNELLKRGDKTDLIELKDIVIRSRIETNIKIQLLDYIDLESDHGWNNLRSLLYDLLKAEDAIQEAKDYSDIHELVNAITDRLDPSIKGYSKKQIDIAIMLILHEKSLRDTSFGVVVDKYLEEYKKGGGVF
jgi:hypothetical protein